MHLELAMKGWVSTFKYYIVLPLLLWSYIAIHALCTLLCCSTHLYISQDWLRLASNAIVHIMWNYNSQVA